ncbi:MAG: class I SAM-dependent methyltransferase [Eggerthellaceae bacterium]|nr:class I SAM-dependent methyltransferase [Eggerthellaceae bacterium]
MSWSVDGQTPEFLAATRMVSLSDAIVKTILGQLRLQPGMRVLDVGCGSGEYAFRLGAAVEGVEFVGLEYDAAFVDFANKRSAGEVDYPFEEPNPANTYRFVCGNGLDLPFDDGSFDAVISHTYLTALPDWACALAEMCRVCKPGDTVSSVTSLTDDFYGTGTISLFSKLFDPESAELLQLVDKAKAAAFKDMNLMSGIPPRKAPVAFDWIGLENVRCTPLAHYACLSDAETTGEFKQRYVDLLFAHELSQLEHLKASPEARALLTDEQFNAYEKLMEWRRDELKNATRDREWNWYGNASLLVCGTKLANGPDPRWAALRDANHEVQEVLNLLSDAGLKIDAQMEQLGPGRCVKATLTFQDIEPITVCGFDPPRALMEACGRLAMEKAALPVKLQDLAEQESLFSQAENRLEACSEDAFPKLPDKTAFKSEDIWEAVSEAAIAGTAIEFKDAGEDDGLFLVICEASSASGATRAIAAHPDQQEALRRAFSRVFV